MVSHELPADRGPAAVPLVLRRRTEGGVSYALRPDEDLVGGGWGDLAPADAYFPARRRRPASGLRWHREVSEGPALARPDPVPRIFPRRQRDRARRQSPDGLDRPGRQAHRTERRVKKVVSFR